MDAAYDLSKLVSIKVHAKQESLWFSFKAFKKSFWGNTKEGFYSILNFEDCFSKEEIQRRGYLIENNIVYNKPYVQLNFTGGISYEKKFDRKEEAIWWANKQLEKGISIPLIISEA